MMIVSSHKRKGTFYPFTTAPSGSDQMGAIQAFINSVPDGTESNPSIIKFIYGELQGDYIVTNTITLTNRNWVVLEGPSPTNKVKFKRLVRPPSHNLSNHARDWHVEVWRSNNIVVRNVFIESYHTASYGGSDFDATYATTPPDREADSGNPGSWWFAEREHGFQINGSKDVLVEDIETLNIRSYNVHITREVDVAPERESERVTVRRSKALHGGGWGMACPSGRDILFDTFDTQKMGFGIVDLEPIGGNETVDRLTIRNVIGSAHGIAIGAHGINIVNNILIEDVHVLGHNRYPLVTCVDTSLVTQRQNWTVRRVTHAGTPPCDNGNDESGSPVLMQSEFYFRKVTNVTVEDCQAQAANVSYMAGVHFYDCAGTLVVQRNNLGEACASLGGAGAVRIGGTTPSVTISGNTRDGVLAC